MGKRAWHTPIPHLSLLDRKVGRGLMFFGDKETSNIEQPTSNTQYKITAGPRFIGCSVLDVGCSMFQAGDLLFSEIVLVLLLVIENIEFEDDKEQKSSCSCSKLTTTLTNKNN